jgi:hypothetical protein
VHLGVGLLSRAFDLGMSRRVLVQLTGGSSATRFMLWTEQGRWMVKTTCSPPAWELHQMWATGFRDRVCWERSQWAAGARL